MAFGDFTFPQVTADLGISWVEADLYPGVVPLVPRPELVEALADGLRVALAVHTEKARSEFLIAPVLMELRRLTHHSFGLFSGTTFDVDPSRGLNGVCDFILSRSTRMHVLTAPLVAIAEAKNDILRSGYGQCIASMVAARIFNEREGSPPAAIHGVVTTGNVWKFMRLEGSVLTIDFGECHIDNVGLILSILQRIVTAP